MRDGTPACHARLFGGPALLAHLCWLLATVFCLGLSFAVVLSCARALRGIDWRNPTRKIPHPPYALLLCAHAWRLAASARSVLGVPEL